MFLSYIVAVICPLLLLHLFRRFVDMLRLFSWSYHLIFTIRISVKLFFYLFLSARLISET